METGLIFDIKRYSINDGPGIRVTVFFKGCNLNCAWCHNPESISHKVEKLYSVNRCIRCGACTASCSQDACVLTAEGIVTDYELCRICGKCADVCPTTASEISGRYETTDNILKIIEKETVFFDKSEGGATFSGGEPLLQLKFLFELLDGCGRKDIHRAVDTAGLINSETLLEAARRTDLFLYDFKMFDPDRHKRWTGVSNEKIKENLVLLAETGSEINIRIPLIAEVNDDEENISKSAEFISKLPGEKKKINLLPYHNIAQQKYRKLGREFNIHELEEPPKERVAEAAAVFESYGLPVKIGG